MTDKPTPGSQEWLRRWGATHETAIIGVDVAKGEGKDYSVTTVVVPHASHRFLQTRTKPDSYENMIDVCAKCHAIKGRTESVLACPGIPPMVGEHKTGAIASSAHCEHPPVKIKRIAPCVEWCVGCGSWRDCSRTTGDETWIRPHTVKEIEALREELRAVHSDLGDASQSVFDLFESLRLREAETVRMINEHRATVGKLTDTIENLKRDLEIAKAAL